ncbi:MAG TPA: cyclopropane-fatty-acyl-phospholipid synthase family protein [Bryobacteraceae bacterium]|nr:cyclopropane-fatty-acyl-phospholipid synthase family protein [Bryobacteraceae bacterium]
MNDWTVSLFRKLFRKTLEGLTGGSLELVSGGECARFGDPAAGLHATLMVHNEHFYQRAITGGDVGLGESYMDGDWSSPDLVSVVRLAVRNLDRLEQQSGMLSALGGVVERIRHRRRANTIAGSRRNIGAHYDLSNDFFRLFLDRSMMYSCAWYESAGDSLETAQSQKLDRICRKLDLQPEDRVLEIGTGWGAFALHAVRHYGCHVTTTTISKQQHDYARESFDREDAGRRIELLFEDYRNLRGRYDKIVSIEMFEAVGYEFYDTYFGACDRLLAPDGAMLLQTITMNDRKFAAYRKQIDWIQKYIFPGSELASLQGILASLARATRLAPFHVDDMGRHYARTLAAWRERFNGSLATVKSLGFDDRFTRMWDYYLAYCEGAFEERHISDVQLMLTKCGSRRTLYQEPGLVGQALCRSDVVGAARTSPGRSRPNSVNALGTGSDLRIHH